VHVHQPLRFKSLAALQGVALPAGKSSVRITVLYDNQELDKRLIASHGFSCLIEVNGEKILFDTGGNPAVLFYNMGVLGLNPRSLTAVVVSHHHWDHAGGLSHILSLNPGIRAALPTSSDGHVTESARTVGPLEVDYKGVRIREQALAVATPEGVVLLVGCAHPGVEKLVSEAAKVFPGTRVAAVIGGFHLVESREEEAVSVAWKLRALGVEKVAPCHCTGKRAAEAMSRVYRSVLPCGVGASYSFGGA